MCGSVTSNVGQMLPAASGSFAVAAVYGALANKANNGHLGESFSGENPNLNRLGDPQTGRVKMSRYLVIAYAGNHRPAVQHSRDRGFLQRMVGWEAASTLKRYEPILDGFVEFLLQKRRSAPIATDTPSEVERFRDEELRQGKSAVTANFTLKVLRAVFNSARRKGLTPTNPAEAVELMPEDCEERLPFTEEQIRQLLPAANTEWIGMIFLGLHAGLRLNDAANLTWENVDLVNRTLSFRPQKTAGRKQGKKRETVIFLHPDLFLPKT